MRICCYCGRLPDDEDDLRPYGPDGAYTCFACAMKPENMETTNEQFSEQIDDLVRSIVGKNVDVQIIVIGGSDGPEAADINDLPAEL